MSAPLSVDKQTKMWYAIKRAEERCPPDIMGVSYRDAVKGRERARRRARASGDSQTAITARYKAIREQNRKKAAQALQYEMRLDGS